MKEKFLGSITTVAMVEKDIALTVWLVSSVRSISFLGVVC
jgi:hypothetical protein